MTKRKKHKASTSSHKTAAERKLLNLIKKEKEKVAKIAKKKKVKADIKKIASNLKAKKGELKRLNSRRKHAKKAAKA